MMSTIDNYLTGLNKIRNKLMPLYEEAFGNKNWLDKNICTAFWLNPKPETCEKEGIGKINFWLYVPEIGEYKTGKSAQAENGSLLALKDGSDEWIKSLKEFAEKRNIIVAKADFYRSLMGEMIELGRELI
jgi:hypothetical protein